MKEMADPCGRAISFDYSIEMKSLFHKLFLLAALCCLTASCDEEDVEISDVAVLVSPNQETEVTLNSGEKALYTVAVTTSHDHVTSLEITSFDPQNGLIKWVDMPINKKEYTDIPFIYTAPEISSETMDVTLTFQASDNQGNTVSVTRKVTVVSKTVSIAEQTGITLFDPSLGLQDALSLSDVSRPFNLADSPTPENADIYIDSSTGFDEITWLSNTRTKFVRYNSFNYSGASAADIASVFRTSVPADNVRDIRVNDIILVGHGDKAEGVFLVVNILQGQTTARCMQLNYKGILSIGSGEEPSGEEDPVTTTPSDG